MRVELFQANFKLATIEVLFRITKPLVLNSTVENAASPAPYGRYGSAPTVVCSLQIFQPARSRQEKRQESGSKQKSVVFLASVPVMECVPTTNLLTVQLSDVC